MKVIVHSKGMISFGVERAEPSEEAIRQVKETKVFRKLVSLMGEEQANRFVEGRTRNFPDSAESQAAAARAYKSA